MARSQQQGIDPGPECTEKASETIGSIMSTTCGLGYAGHRLRADDDPGLRIGGSSGERAVYLASFGGPGAGGGGGDGGGVRGGGIGG